MGGFGSRGGLRKHLPCRNNRRDTLRPPESDAEFNEQRLEPFIDLRETVEDSKPNSKEELVDEQ